MSVSKVSRETGQNANFQWKFYFSKFWKCSLKSRYKNDQEEALNCGSLKIYPWRKLLQYSESAFKLLINYDSEEMKGEGDFFSQSLTEVLWPVQAYHRKLTGSDKRLRKDKIQKKKMQKSGVKWVGCPDGDTQQPPPHPVSLLYTSSNQEIDQQFSGRGGTWHSSYQEQEESAITTLCM
jgi:hypothetical protein